MYIFGIRGAHLVWAGAALLTLCCGNLESTLSDTASDSEAQLSDGGGSDENPDGGITDTTDTQTGGEAACTVLTLNLHEGSGQALVILSDMTVTNEDIEVYDFAMVNQMPDPPAIFLGQGVTALNLGNETPFAAVSEAPADGYRADDETAVIGTEWRTGGNGTDGHIVSGNVYVLKTEDGKFGKISVTSAVQGLATIDAYFQADGSSSLECAFLP